MSVNDTSSVKAERTLREKMIEDMREVHAKQAEAVAEVQVTGDILVLAAHCLVYNGMEKMLAVVEGRDPLFKGVRY